jgi:hypothetical protein
MQILDNWLLVDKSVNPLKAFLQGMGDIAYCENNKNKEWNL